MVIREITKTGNTFNNATRAARVEMKIAKLQKEIKETDSEIATHLHAFRQQKIALDKLDDTIDQLKCDNDERRNELEGLQNPGRASSASRKSEPHHCMFW